MVKELWMMEIGQQIRKYREKEKYSQEYLVRNYMFRDKPFLIGKMKEVIQISIIC